MATKTTDISKDDKTDGQSAETVEQLDMSIGARMERVKAELNAAIDEQNNANRIVAEKTKELDELIIENEGSEDKNPMSEIQFYLNSQQRKRQQDAEQTQRMIANGIDPIQLIKQLDTRAPIDQKQAARKVDPLSVVPAAVKPVV